MGMRPIVVDSGDKKELCMKMGAEAFVDFTQEKDVPAKVREIADGVGAHGVLVTAYQAYEREWIRISHRTRALTQNRGLRFHRQQERCKDHGYRDVRLHE